jgi:hypothetical protein
MKFPVRSIVVLGILATVASPLSRALPEADATAGRLIARRFGDTIVGVRCTIVMRLVIGDHAMPPSEQKIDINGTMIADSGLTVTAFSAIDPKAIFEASRAQFNNSNQSVDLGQTDFKALRLRLADGTEIPARIAGKDPARDLMFLMPDDAAAAGRRPFTYVNLNETPEAAKVLGDYFHLSRAGEVLQRVLLVRPSTVTGIIERPNRLLLVSTDSFGDALGCPVFDSDGNVLGICVRYIEKGLPKGTVLIPAADLVAAMTKAMSHLPTGG